jgi:hypothetical protein
MSALVDTPSQFDALEADLLERKAARQAQLDSLNTERAEALKQLADARRELAEEKRRAVAEMRKPKIAAIERRIAKIERDTDKAGYIAVIEQVKMHIADLDREHEQLIAEHRAELIERARSASEIADGSFALTANVIEETLADIARADAAWRKAWRGYVPSDDDAQLQTERVGNHPSDPRRPLAAFAALLDLTTKPVHIGRMRPDRWPAAQLLRELAAKLRVLSCQPSGLIVGDTGNGLSGYYENVATGERLALDAEQVRRQEAARAVHVDGYGFAAWRRLRDLTAEERETCRLQRLADLNWPGYVAADRRDGVDVSRRVGAIELDPPDPDAADEPFATWLDD